MVLVFILMIFYEGTKLLRAFLQRGQITEGLFTEGPKNWRAFLQTGLFTVRSFFLQMGVFRSIFMFVPLLKGIRALQNHDPFSYWSMGMDAARRNLLFGYHHGSRRRIKWPLLRNHWAFIEEIWWEGLVALRRNCAYDCWQGDYVSDGDWTSHNPWRSKSNFTKSNLPWN